MGKRGCAGWPRPPLVLTLPARGPFGQVLTLAAVLAVAHLARGDADEADSPHIVELVAFVAVQTTGEIPPQLSHCHWWGKTQVLSLSSITPSCFPWSL